VLWQSKGHGQQSHGKNEVRDDAGSGERTDACQGLGMEEGQQQRFMGRQVAARGKLQGVEVQGLKIRDNELLQESNDERMRWCKKLELCESGTRVAQNQKYKRK
jgi:hypothetical protein